MSPDNGQPLGFLLKRGEEHTVVMVATDDMAVTSKIKTDIGNFKTEIKKCWDITNNGPINWFLGFKIKQDRNNRTLSINQCGTSKVLTKGFSDTNWAGQKDRHSISGYLFYFGQGVISWSSKRQHIIVLSSTKAEYIAQMHTTKEVLWLRSFVNEVWEQLGEPVGIKCNNQGAIALANFTLALNILTYATILSEKQLKKIESRWNTYLQMKM